MPVYHVRPVPQGGGWHIAPDGSPFALQTFRQRGDAIREARKLRGRSGERSGCTASTGATATRTPLRGSGTNGTLRWELHT